MQNKHVENRPPRAGDTIRSDRLGVCHILKVRPAGTLDVEAADGRCYRITGLAFALMRPASKEEKSDPKQHTS